MARNLFSFAFLLMLLCYIVAEPSEGLYFSCFNHKSKEECHGIPTLSKYCIWSDSDSSCRLSPFSLVMLCKFDHQPTICEQARDTCSQVMDEDLCILQSDVCEWDSTSGSCVALPPTGEDFEGKPPTESTQPPTEDENQNHRPCCNHGRKVCNGKAKKAQMRAARAKCGVSRGSSKKVLCAKWREMCS